MLTKYCSHYVFILCKFPFAPRKSFLCSRFSSFCRSLFLILCLSLYYFYPFTIFIRTFEINKYIACLEPTAVFLFFLLIVARSILSVSLVFSQTGRRWELLQSFEYVFIWIIMRIRLLRSNNLFGELIFVVLQCLSVAIKKTYERNGLKLSVTVFVDV